MAKMHKVLKQCLGELSDLVRGTRGRHFETSLREGVSLEGRPLWEIAKSEIPFLKFFEK